MSVSAHLPLPIALDEITRGWLTAALHTKAPAVTVRDFAIVDTIYCTTTKIRLRLAVDDAVTRYKHYA